MLRLLAVLLSVLFGATGALAAPAETARPIAVLISIDGFRPDYLDRGVTPVMSALAASGARGVMRPSFPVKTFPNHYALVTGLRPDRNGIVDNTIEDPEIPGVTFKMSNHEAVVDRRWWDQGEPIWVAAERQGLATATMFWPGSEAAIRGVRPRHWAPFDQALTSQARVDRLLAWMDGPEPPAFATIYFDVVDTAGHNYGPRSPEVDMAAADVDAAIGRLASGLKARGLAANLIIVADHGMAEVSPDRRINLDDLVPRSAFRPLTAGAFVSLYPAPGRLAEVEAGLLGGHPHMSCWRKAEIPARFRYGRNPRAAPIVCLPQVGWTLTTRDYRPSRPERGAHGFDPEAPEMAAVFIASGPSFRAGVVLPPFDNVDVYPLLARLIGVRAEPGDGTLASSLAALVP